MRCLLKYENVDVICEKRNVDYMSNDLVVVVN